MEYSKKNTQYQEGLSIKKRLAIIGANVTLEDNKGIGTITDVDGKFVLNGISNGAILLISYIGYIDQKLR